jgi:hypothetical protein
MKNVRLAMTIVLALGGCGPLSMNGSASRAALALPPGSGTSVPIAALLEAREGPACALVGTGSVLVAGGRTGSSAATSTAELIDASGAVHPLGASLGVARAFARAVALDEERVLVVGGHDASGSALASTEIYSSALGAFVPGPTLAAGRDRSAVAVLGSLVLVAGGVLESSVETIEIATLSTHALRGHFAAPHADAEIVVSGRTAVVGGGHDTAAPEGYDLDAESAFLLGVSSEVRGQTLLAAGGAVLLEGGSDGVAFLTASTERLAGTGLVQNQTLGQPRVHGIAAPFMGGVLVLEGDDGTGEVARADLILGPSSATGGPVLVLPRDGATAVPLADGRVVVVGGVLATGAPCGDCEMLLPPGAPAPSASAAFASAASSAQALASESAALGQAQSALAAADAKLAALAAQIAALSSERAVLAQEVATLTRGHGGKGATPPTSSTTPAPASTAAAAVAALDSANAAVATLARQVAFDAQALAGDQKIIQALDQTIDSDAQTLTKLTGVAHPGAVPQAAPLLGATTITGPFTAATDPGRPAIEAISPAPGVPGQTARVWLSTGATTSLYVFFSGVPATVVDQGKGTLGGATLDYADVIVPASLSAGSYSVQVVGDALVSDAFAYAIN